MPGARGGRGAAGAAPDYAPPVHTDPPSMVPAHEVAPAREDAVEPPTAPLPRRSRAPIQQDRELPLETRFLLQILGTVIFFAFLAGLMVTGVI